VLTKGKNLSTTSPYFTSLQTLYYMNEQLLSTNKRVNEGWGDGKMRPKQKNLKEFKRFRPSSEEYIDQLYVELATYWDGILEALPVLWENPPKMRVHNPTGSKTKQSVDHFLFWPICQEVMAEATRWVLTKCLADPNNPTKDTVKTQMNKFNSIDWCLHNAPWRDFVLVQDAKGTWKIRSDDRAQVMKICKRMLVWMLGFPLSQERVVDLKTDWQFALSPKPTTQKEIDSRWNTVVESREKILSM